MPNKPVGWTPPYPSWIATFPEDGTEVAVAYLGVQRRRSVDAHALLAPLDAVLAAHGPDHRTHAHYRDASNYENDVRIAYWRDLRAFESFLASPAFASAWSLTSATTADVGWWLEAFTIPRGRFETLFSSEHPEGVAHTTRGMTGPVEEHAYNGAMRDRIPDSRLDRFEAPPGTTLELRRGVESRGRRLRVTPPHNLCLIRSGQDWSDCGRDEYAVYADVVQPNLRAGMDFLRDNPVETGCLSCRFMDETDADGALRPKSFASAMFLTMKHLETWTWTHRTHRAIYQSFHELVQARNFHLDLKLWHEVFVLDARRCHFEYVNCHPRTGLLATLPAEPVPG
jgi:hypothetical protein